MFDPTLLKNQTIIVTGGGSGLGKSMATRFSALGANVVIAARTMERLEAAAAEIHAQTGGEVLPVSVDIRDPSACEAVVQSATERFGEVTGLMNNAAGNFLCPSEDLSVNGFNAVVDIVLKGTWFMTQAVGKQMIAQQKGGAVVSILTTYVYTGSSFVLPSAMAKAALLAMTRSLAVEWTSAYDIRLNAIAPGPFPTDGAWSALVPDPEAAAEEVRKKIPMKRFGEHAELADLAAYLMSSMSGYINGTCVDIDGGEWLQGAGEFNRFVEYDRANLKQLMASMRPKKK